MPGTVVQINVSHGGAPEHAVPQAVVNRRGIVEDDQADQRHDGSREQALCLYSMEVIEALQAEGHPINAGAAGEK